MATNWRAIQIPRDPKTKKPMVPKGVRVKYMSMASWKRNAGGKTGSNK